MSLEIDRYLAAIRGYTPEKMAQHGQPYLSELRGRLEEVRRLIAQRA